MKIVALLPVVMLFANAVGLLTQVLIPHFLIPSEYTIFSTTWAYGQVVSVFFFEWLRLSVLRFSEGADAQVVVARRRVMASSLLLIAAVLLGATAIAWISHQVIGAPALVGAVSFYACCQGVFDSLQARRRAASQHTSFIIIWSLRSVLSLILALGIAALTKSGLATLLVLALSYPISLLSDLRRVPSKINTMHYDAEHLRFMFSFGAFMATANALGLLFPALLRFQAGLYLPVAAAGGIVLAFDYFQKVVGLAGLAINIIVSQKSFHSAEFDSASKQITQVKIQLFAPAFLILSASAAFVILVHSIGRFLVPDGYLNGFNSILPYAALASALMAVRMYSVDPLFVMAARTRTAIVGPMVTLLIVAALGALLILKGIAPVEALGISAGSGTVAGLLVSFFILRRSIAMPPAATNGLTLITFIGAGLFLALKLPALPVWADLPARLVVLGLIASLGPLLIFRTEFISEFRAARLGRT